MSGCLHELVPENEVEQEEDYDVAREENRVLAISLIKVVEDGEVQLVKQLLV